MKFRFCGELDCPDWILREITVLIKITSVRFKLLCGQVITGLLGGSIDYDKVTKLLTKETTISLSDIKAAIAALQWILSSGAKYNVDETTLSNELQQLGLPKELCDSLSKSYRDNKDKLRLRFTEETLQLTRLDSMDWRVDYLLSSSLRESLNIPTVQFKLNTLETEGPASYTFEMTPDKLRVLLAELKSAKEIMDGIA